MQKWSLCGFVFSADYKSCNLTQISFYCIYMAEEDIWLAYEVLETFTIPSPKCNSFFIVGSIAFLLYFRQKETDL